MGIDCGFCMPFVFYYASQMQQWSASVCVDALYRVRNRRTDRLAMSILVVLSALTESDGLPVNLI